MGAVVVFLVALLPVLFIGAVLVEMLVARAPRRGKRPDTPVERAGARTVRVIAADGRVLRGTPRRLVFRLGGWRFTDEGARRLLEEWERSGRVLVQGDW